jgi:hypothetical protein
MRSMRIVFVLLAGICSIQAFGDEPTTVMGCSPYQFTGQRGVALMINKIKDGYYITRDELDRPGFRDEAEIKTEELNGACAVTVRDLKTGSVLRVNLESKKPNGVYTAETIPGPGIQLDSSLLKSSCEVFEPEWLKSLPKCNQQVSVRDSRVASNSRKIASVSVQTSTRENKTEESAASVAK